MLKQPTKWLIKLNCHAELVSAAKRFRNKLRMTIWPQCQRIKIKAL